MADDDAFTTEWDLKVARKKVYANLFLSNRHMYIHSLNSLNTHIILITSDYKI